MSIEDNLLQQAGGTVIELLVGTAVLTGLFHLSLWLIRSARGRLVELKPRIVHEEKRNRG